MVWGGVGNCFVFFFEYWFIVLMVIGIIWRVLINIGLIDLGCGLGLRILEWDRKGFEFWFFFRLFIWFWVGVLIVLSFF